MSIFPTLVLVLAMGWVVVESRESVRGHPFNVRQFSTGIDRLIRYVSKVNDHHSTDTSAIQERAREQVMDILGNLPLIGDYIRNFGMTATSIKYGFQWYNTHVSELRFGYCLADDYFEIGQRIAQAQKQAESEAKVQRKDMKISNRVEPSIVRLNTESPSKSSEFSYQHSRRPLIINNNSNAEKWYYNTPYNGRKSERAKRSEVARQDSGEPMIWKVVGKVMYWRNAVRVIIEKIGFLRCTFQYLLVRFWKWVAS